MWKAPVIMCPICEKKMSWVVTDVTIKPTVINSMSGDTTFTNPLNDVNIEYVCPTCSVGADVKWSTRNPKFMGDKE